MSRANRERELTVAGTPAEIHVAPDVPTLLLFPADIQKKTLTVDESRIRVVDTGARSIIVQAVKDYRPDEREELEVFGLSCKIRGSCLGDRGHGSRRSPAAGRLHA